jgi:hypothetical protein
LLIFGYVSFFSVLRWSWLDPNLWLQPSKKRAVRRINWKCIGLESHSSFTGFNLDQSRPEALGGSCKRVD